MSNVTYGASGRRRLRDQRSHAAAARPKAGAGPANDVSDVASIGLIAVDAQETIVFVNQWMTDRWRGEAVLAADAPLAAALELGAGSGAMTVLGAVRACLRKGRLERLSRYIHPGFLPLRDPLDPSVALVQDICVRPLGGAGAKRGCVIEVVDVTAEAACETKMRRGGAELATLQANHALLLSAVSHDIREALAASARDSRSASGGRKPSERDVRDAIAAIDDLVAFEQLESVQTPSVSFNPKPVFENVIDAMGASARVTVIAVDDLPDICCDADELALIARVLIGAALKASDRRTDRIAISGGQNQEQAWINVTDDGPGLDIERFERAGASSAKGPGGDLGYIIARRLLHKRGGALEARSPIAGGRGAVVTASWPKNRLDCPPGAC